MTTDLGYTPMRLTRRALLGWCGPVLTMGAGIAAGAARPLAAASLKSKSAAKLLPLTEGDGLWIDPAGRDDAHTKFKLYPQHSRRDAGAQGSYQIYLPPQYDSEPTRRFPVIYWLHDEPGNARDGALAVEHIHNGIVAGKMPPMIVVCPQALPHGWYIDSKDGARPVEQVMVYDLIRQIDTHYRTIADRPGRYLEGFGMGGYGALHLGLKHSDLYGRVSVLAPSIPRTLADEPRERTNAAFLGDPEYYAACHPLTLALGNCAQIRKILMIRLARATEDVRYRGAVSELRDRLLQLDIPHQYDAPAVGHNCVQVMDRLDERYFEFWAKPQIAA
jgi:enterochelin esterase-like enzyme